MMLFRSAFRRETAVPMLALIFASGASLLLVIARIAWTGNVRYGFLLWNLFLAWLPLLFALSAHEYYYQGRTRSWPFAAFAVAWLLFFPNSPYIFTDLTHLTARFYGQFWVDLSLILLCALTGFLLGFLSLFLMQTVVAHTFGGVVGWIFALVVAALTGFGIYLGRFLRFNSWDVVFKPAELYREIGSWMANPLAQPKTGFAFPLLFAAFLFISYVMLYSLTCLKEVTPRESRPRPTSPDATGPVAARRESTREAEPSPR